MSINATWGAHAIKIRHNQAYNFPYADPNISSIPLLPPTTGTEHAEVLQQGGRERKKVRFDSYVSSFSDYETLQEASFNGYAEELTSPGVTGWPCIIKVGTPVLIMPDHIRFSVEFIEVDEPAVALIEVSGASAITIPSEGNETEEYTAVVKDQYGQTMTGEDVTWSVVDVDGTDVAGSHVSIDQNGVVTVASTATAQEDSFKVVATSDTDVTVAGEAVVSLEA